VRRLLDGALRGRAPVPAPAEQVGEALA